MDSICSIVLGVFAGALLLYAGLMALTKDYKILPIRGQQAVKPKDPKRYTAQFAKVIALVAAAPAIGAIVGIWSVIAAVVVTVAGIVVCIWLGTKIMRGVQ